MNDSSKALYKILSLDNKEEWDSIVHSFKDFEVFYLAEYVKAFELEGHGTPLLFYYNDGTTRGINVFMKRDISKDEHFKNKIPNNSYFDIASPYGYGGFIIDGSNYDAINKCFVEYCKDNNIISEFVRFNLFDNSYKHYYGSIQKSKINIIRKLDISINDILMDFDHKVRKNLKRAISNHLMIKLDYSSSTLDDFLKIYYSTMKRNNAKNEYYFPKEFFYQLNSMKNNVVYFNVLYNNTIISTELILYDNNNCYSYLGGTLNEYYNLRPNDFLKCEVIKWAYDHHLKNFVLGGGYTDSINDGILKYKKSFAPNNGNVDFYVGKNIFDENRYSELLNIRNSDNGFDSNSNFFPLYRA